MKKITSILFGLLLVSTTVFAGIGSTQYNPAAVGITGGSISGTTGQIVTAQTDATNALAGGHYGQTWQAVARVSGTQYTNTTGKAIYCLVAGTTTEAGAARVIVAPTVGGVAIHGQACYDATGSASSCVAAFIVPAGQTYSVTVTTSSGTPSISGASELR